MVFSKKRSRRIVVMDKVYYWRPRGDYWLPDDRNLFQVRPEQAPHRRLEVKCGQCSGADGFSGTVTPRIVRHCIEFALSSGWPNERPNLLVMAFNEPFRAITVHPFWLTSTVRSLVRGIYADSAFERMPILADALQDAGCENEFILNHCRQAADHTRRCWVMDLLLGKQ